jgi:hypothetical protein
MKKKYTVLVPNYTVDGETFSRYSIVELTEKQAAADLKARYIHLADQNLEVSEPIRVSGSKGNGKGKK